MKKICCVCIMIVFVLSMTCCSDTEHEDTSNIIDKEEKQEQTSNNNKDEQDGKQQNGNSVNKGDNGDKVHQVVSFSKEDWLSKKDFRQIKTFGESLKGILIFEFDLVPFEDGKDCVVGYGGKEAVLDKYKKMSIIIWARRLGYFSVGNGSSYQSLQTLKYTKEKNYHVKIVADTKIKKFDVYITPENGEETLIAYNYEFTKGFDNISKVCIMSKSGDDLFKISNHKITVSTDRFDKLRTPPMIDRDKTKIAEPSVKTDIVSGFRENEVFKEYKWNGPFKTYADWLAVTDPNTTNDGAFKVNPVNKINIKDLKGATKVDMVIEQWSGHAGTSDKKVKINDSDWYRIPEPDIGKNPESYQYRRCVGIQVPIEVLNEGENTFQFSCGSQIKHDFNWGQWGVYGVLFRVYYSGEESKCKGRVIAPKIIDNKKVILKAEVNSENCEVEKVDFFAFFEDYDHDGDGIYNEWQYKYVYTELKKHIGTATKAPYNVEWDTAWIPDQDKPVKLMACITTTDGTCHMTPVIDGIILERKDTSVVMYKPYNIPERWQTRKYKKHKCQIDINNDLDQATDAKLVFATWSGAHADQIGINNNVLVKKTGLRHNYSYDEISVPLKFLQNGTNTFYTYSSTSEHGVEVLWPGPVLKVRYKKD